jgi:Domain of unknown function (DUF4832)/Domain of unknown function (DUF4874)
MKLFYKLFLGGVCTFTLILGASQQLGANRQPQKIAASNPPQSSATILTRYQPSNKNFPNPERGLAAVYDPPWPSDLKITWGFCNPSPANAQKYTYTAWTKPLNASLLKSHRAQNISTVMVRYHIAEFRGKPLSQKFLDRLNNDFAAVRKAGLKSAIRFAYNWPMGGPDTTMDKVLLHLDQLKPLLKKNVDVIAFMDAGFIGCWGEWHTSSNNLIGMDANSNAEMNQTSRLIADKILEVLPPERMVTVRYPRYKFDYFGSKNSKPITPLKSTEAFTGKKKARWGQHDDCLVCGEWNFSTYWSPRQQAEEIKNYLNQDNQYVVQSGEPGDVPKKIFTDEDGDGYKDNYESCPRVLDIFSRTRWSILNGDYNPGSPTSAYKRWQKDGCYEEIAKKLGYRFRLVESSIPRQVKLGGKLSMSFKIANDGWASPYNPRKLEVILRNRKNRSITRVPLRNDPRFWQAGGEYLVKVDNRLPKLAVGEYDVLLNLPDPKPTLKNRSEYAIRLANQDVWEEATGYNSLLRSIVVK